MADGGFRTPWPEHTPTPPLEYIDPLPETIGDGIVKVTRTQHAAQAKTVECHYDDLFYGPKDPADNQRGYEAIAPKPGSGHALGSTKQ